MIEVFKKECPNARAMPSDVSRDAGMEVIGTRMTCDGGIAVRAAIYHGVRELYVLLAAATIEAQMDVDRLFSSVAFADKPPPSDDGLAWQTFRNPYHSYEVLLPGAPTVTLVTIEDSRKMEIATIPVGHRSALFSVIVMDMPEGTSETTAKESLQGLAWVPACRGDKFTELPKADPTAAARYLVQCAAGETLLVDMHVRAHAVYAVVASLMPNADELRESSYRQFRLSFRTLD